MPFPPSRAARPHGPNRTRIRLRFFVASPLSLFAPPVRGSSVWPVRTRIRLSRFHRVPRRVTRRAARPHAASSSRFRRVSAFPSRNSSRGSSARGFVFSLPSSSASPLHPRRTARPHAASSSRFRRVFRVPGARLVRTARSHANPSFSLPSRPSSSDPSHGPPARGFVNLLPSRLPRPRRATRRAARSHANPSFSLPSRPRRVTRCATRRAARPHADSFSRSRRVSVT